MKEIERVRHFDPHRAVYKVPCSQPECRKTGEIILSAEQAKEYETNASHWYCVWHRRFTGVTAARGPV